MTKGEEVKVKTHYDLLGNDVYGKTGIYVSTTASTHKLLVYFPEFEEWGEFLIDDVERISPGVVNAENIKFIKHVKKLEFTLTAIAC